MKSATHRLGFWSGILSAIFSVLWFITFSMQDVFAQVPPWQNLEAYAEAYSIARLTLIYPSLLLALTYLVLIVAVHRTTAEEDKVWSLAALAVGVLYATMGSINYNIQAVAVRQSLAAGEVGGVEMWIPDNPHSIYTALSNCYGYMAISMVLAGFAIRGGGLARWVRTLFFAQAITAIGQFGWTMADLPMPIFIATSMIWVIGAPAAFIMLAVLFRRRAVGPESAR